MTIADINQEARDLVDADTTSYPAAALLRRVNMAYEDVVSKIIGMDGTWQFDDTNYSTLPIGTTTLVNAQKDYSFDATFLNVERVEVLDVSGNWQLLRPIDKSQMGVAVSEFHKVDGLPMYYDKNGTSIFLYPAPATGSVTMASGLKVYFQRNADLFTSAQVTTGTKEPGFAINHVVLAYKAALPYAMTYKKDRVPGLIAEINRFEKEIMTHYGRREKDARKVMSMRNISHR